MQESVTSLYTALLCGANFILHAYEPPPLDASVDEALRDFMARKKASMPDIWH